MYIPSPPLPSSSFFFFFLSLWSLSRPLTHLAHVQVMRSGSARSGRKHLDRTQGQSLRCNESSALRRTLRSTRPCCSSHPCLIFIAQKTISWATSWETYVQKNRNSSPSYPDSPEQESSWLRYHLPLLSSLPALFSLVSFLLDPKLTFTLILCRRWQFWRDSSEHNHKSDTAAPTSLVPLQLANYHILKRAYNLPTNNRTATNVNTRPHPSILSSIFFFFSCHFIFVFLSCPCTHLLSNQSSQLPQNNPGCPQEQGRGHKRFLEASSRARARTLA